MCHVTLQVSEVTGLVDLMDEDGDRSLSMTELLTYLGKEKELAAAAEAAKKRKAVRRKAKAEAKKAKVRFVSTYLSVCACVLGHNACPAVSGRPVVSRRTAAVKLLL